MAGMTADETTRVSDGEEEAVVIRPVTESPYDRRKRGDRRDTPSMLSSPDVSPRSRDLHRLQDALDDT